MYKPSKLYLKTTFLCFLVFMGGVVYAQEMYKVVPLNNLQDGDRVILSVKGTTGFMYPSTNSELRFGQEGTTLPNGEGSVWWTVERNGEYWRFKNVATNDYLAVEENYTSINLAYQKRTGKLIFAPYPGASCAGIFCCIICNDEIKESF